MPTHHPKRPSPMDDQNFSHSAGSPMARLPDQSPQKSDHSSESLNSKIIGAAVCLVILLGIIAWLIFT